MQRPATPDLPLALMRLMEAIPSGSVTTYGALATALGDRSAARWVAEHVAAHPHDAQCACHRVVLRTGELARHADSTEAERKERLEREGVVFIGDRVDLERCGILELPNAAPENDRPLTQLRDFQETIAAAAVLEPFHEEPECVGGVDLAYRANGDGVAALAVVEWKTGLLIQIATHVQRVRFPYLTGYLSFREIDLLLPLLEKQSYLPPVLFVDGNGRLHPRRAGIATTLGVLIDRPTIGVGKKLLCGQTDLAGLSFGTFRPIVEGGETLGAAVRGHDRFKPVFLSPGHRIDLPSALRLTFPQFLGHRLPEALFQADHLSKRVARS